MSQGREGDPTKSDDEADIDTIELLLRPEEFARLESIWDAQTAAPGASRPVPDPSHPGSESADELITGPFDVTRLRSEYSEASDEPPAAVRTDSTVELPPLRLTPDGQPATTTRAAAALENIPATSADGAEPTIALPALRLTPDGQPTVAALPAVSQPASHLAPAARTHFQYSAPAPRDDPPKPTAVPKPPAVGVPPAPFATVVADSVANPEKAPAEPPSRAPLSVEQFAAPVTVVAKPIAVATLAKVSPLSVEPRARKAPTANAAPRQQARWPWVALSAMGTGLVLIIAWLFSVESSPHADHTKAPAAAPVVPFAPALPVEPAKAAPVPVPVSARASEPYRLQSPAAAPATTVKFTNPFDQREVFEFPAGTSPAEARDAVAEILIQRARDRQSVLGERTRRRASRPRDSRGGSRELVENSTRATN